MLIKYSKYYLLIIAFLFNIANSFAEVELAKLDSLLKRIENTAFYISPKEALIHAGEIQSITIKASDKIYHGRSYYLIGKICRLMGKNSEAMDFATKAESMFSNLGSTKNRILAYHEIAISSGELYLFETSINAAFNAYNLSVTLKDEYLKAVSLKVLGEIFFKLSLFDKAQLNLETALRTFEKQKNANEIGEINNLIGSIFEKQGNIESALQYKLNAYNIIEYPVYKARIAVSIADIYAKQMVLTKTNEYYGVAKQIFKEHEAPLEQSYLNLSMAQTCFYQNDYKNAIVHAESAVKELSTSFIPVLNLKLYDLLVKSLTLTNQKEKALIYSKALISLEDSLEKIQNRYLKDKIENKYELIQGQIKLKEAEQISLNNSNKIVGGELYLTLSLLIAVLSLTFFIAFYRNYLKNKKINKELQLLNKELETKNAVLVDSERKLRETNAIKDKFYSIIAHDIRNPLNPIGVGIEILKQRKKINLDEEKQDKIIGDLEKAANSLGALLENLLQWTNFQKQKMPFNPMPFDLYDIIEDNQGLHEENIKLKKLMFFSDIKRNTTVYADKNMINVVIRNLISNAIKFTKPEGVIKISFAKRDNLSEISIIDTGVGMDAQTVEALFKNDSFHTTAGTYEEKGTGLGLKLCKEFIEKHGGTFTCKSQVNSGSTFKFTLPDRNDMMI